jgi:hypothetical protein
MRFMAIARVSCVSLEMEPKEIAPVLKLFYGNRVLLEVEETAQGEEGFAPLVEVVRVLLVSLEVARLNGPLEGDDGVLVPLVGGTLHPKLIFTPDL